MSRTYRCRSLPKHARKRWGGRWAANKIVDGGGSWRKLNEKVEAETEALIGPRPAKSQALIKAGTHTEYVDVPRPKWYPKKAYPNSIFPFVPWEKNWMENRKAITVSGTWRKTEAAFQWDRARDIVEDNIVLDTANWHPYARKRGLARGKFGEWRRRANREMRRRNRQVANLVGRDPDECDGDWAQKNLYLDRWMFC
jgi:hypothetical protein